MSIYSPIGSRTRKEIERDAFRLITYRQKDCGRALTGSEKAAIIRHEFEDEALRIAKLRFPNGSGSTGTISEIIRALMSGGDVLLGVSRPGADAPKPKGMTCAPS